MIGVQLQGHFTEENISFKFISELKKKNPKWDKITIACEYCTTLLSPWWKTMMDSMLALIPKEHSSQSLIIYKTIYLIYISFLYHISHSEDSKCYRQIPLV